MCNQDYIGSSKTLAETSPKGKYVQQAVMALQVHSTRLKVSCAIASNLGILPGLF